MRVKSTRLFRRNFEENLFRRMGAIRRERDAYVLGGGEVLKFFCHVVYSFFYGSRTSSDAAAYLADRFFVPWLKNLFHKKSNCHHTETVAGMSTHKLLLLKSSSARYDIFNSQKVQRFLMKVRASVKAVPSKGDIIVRRKGRIYVLNKKDPTRKQRQKGPARKK